ncbi:MAG TPA: lipopolysaccharide biosynthesis protein [Solirubrobacterales bacterium]|nr:lipopolysaccharide biosynthesis protein [Solirubrobacterales bacterium]
MPRVGRVRATDEAKRYGRRASLLSVGVGITGLITYLYFAIASHELSKEQYGQIAVLWSAVFIVVSVLQRPVEQLLSRTVSENLAHGVPIRHTVRVAATIQLSVAVAFDIVALALRTPIQDHLLHGNSTLYWIGVAAVTAYGASYFARGFLAGSHRLTIYALQIISESVARTAFPTAVALGIASGQTAVALGIVAAPTLSLIVVPFAFLRRFAAEAESVKAGAAEGSEGTPGERRPEASSAAVPTDEFTLARGGRFAAGVFLIMLSEQTFLNAGPLLVNATAGAAAAGYIFNVLMIARAPLQLFQAVQTSLLPHLTRLGSQGNEKDFRASVRVTILAVAAFAGLVAVAMLIAGPQLMQIAFGKKHDYARGDLVVVSIGMGLYLSAATLNQAALAKGQVRRASMCWIACAVVFIAWTLVPIVDNDFHRVEIGYLGAAALLCSLLYWLYRQPLEPREMRVKPGSTEEMELQLASADEAG